MASGEATRLTYILNTLAQMTIDSSFEERLSELEESKK